MTDDVFRSVPVDLADNPVPEFRSIIAYWEGKRGDAFAPAWRDISLLDFPLKMIANCNVTDLDPESGVISFRFFGTGLADLHTFELTNRTTDAIEPPAFRDLCIGQYREIVAARAPRIYINEIPVQPGLKRRHIMLRLPLSNNGVHVTNVITFEAFDEHRDELKKYYSAMAVASEAKLSN